MTKEQALEILSAMPITTFDGHSFTEIKEAIEMAKSSLSPKKGTWKHIIDDDDKWFRHKFVCSECNFHTAYGQAEYCMHCGAPMNKDPNYKGYT